MSTGKKDQLLHKYLEGNSTSEEEENLFKEQTEEGPLKPWAHFRENSRYEAREGLNSRLESAIDKQTWRRKTLYISLVSAAASFALIVFFFFQPAQNTEMSVEEKQAKLEEILNILPVEENDEGKDVLYEDDLIVIYYATNE